MESKRKKVKQLLASFFKEPSVSLLDEYVSYGGDINRIIRRTTLLCECSRDGHLECSRKLLEYGANVDSRDRLGCSALYLAASYGRFHTAQLLINCGALLDVTNTNQNTALLSALKNGQNKCAELLINSGACVNIVRPNTHGVTLPLLTYVLFVKGDWAMAEKLLRAGLRPYKFMPGLGFILLEDSNTSVELIKLFIYAGFDIYFDGYVEVMSSKGETEQTETQQELLVILQWERHNTPSLQRLCRIAVRSQLSKSNIQLHMSKKILQLPLPVEVQKYVNLDYL